MDMMDEMMPQCLHMMLPSVAKEERIDFVMKMVATLAERGAVGMSDQEGEDFIAEVVEKVRS